MISSKVQRTLVKSPPELWAELSDPSALARHLGELGEVRVTRIEPEQTVEWEAEAASGIVELRASGWGTKVTLSLQRESPAVDEDSPAPPRAEETPAAEASEVEPAEPAMTPVPEAEQPTPWEDALPDAKPSSAVSERRGGFFARLFRRKRSQPNSIGTTEHAVEATAEEATSQAVNETTGMIEEAPAKDAAQAGRATSEPDSVQADDVDLATELREAEEALAAAGVELLNGVLDRLGAAHHRPFSRS